MKRKGIFAQFVLISLVTLIVILLNGCAAKKSMWGDPESGLLLSYRLSEGQVWKMESNSHQITNMEMMGQSMESTTDIIMFSSFKGEGLTSEKNLQTTVTIDSMTMVSKSMRGEREIDVEGLVGKPFGLVLSPLGDEVEFQNADSVAIDLGAIGGGLQSIEQFIRNPFPDLSKTPVKVGESWTQKIDENIPQGGQPVHLILDFTNTLEKIEIFQGEECAVIQSAFEGTIDGEGERMGTAFTMEGDLEGTTTYFFAYKKGYFLKKTSDTLTESTIAVTGQTSMTIPMSQETKVEVILSL